MTFLSNGVPVQRLQGGTTADPLHVAGPDLEQGDVIWTRDGKKQAVKSGRFPRFLISLAHGSTSHAVIFDRSQPPGHDNPHLTTPFLGAATLWISELLAAEAAASTIAAASASSDSPPLGSDGGASAAVPAHPAAEAPTKDREVATVALSRDPSVPVGSVWAQADGTYFARWAAAVRPKGRGEVERTFPTMDALRASLPAKYALVEHEVAR